MKRNRGEEKAMGPMFPRLHVNDTEKGGPRAPPRNKMALYEQLSIPSQRFNPGVVPRRLDSTNLVPTASSSQVTTHDRSLRLPVYVPSPKPTNQAQNSHARTSVGANSNSASSQLVEQKKMGGDEDDFSVPVFVQSGLGQCKTQNDRNIENSTLSCVKYSGNLIKLQSVPPNDQMRESFRGVKPRREVKTKHKEDSKVSDQDKGLQDSPAAFSKFNDGDPCLLQGSRDMSRTSASGCVNGVLVPARNTEVGDVSQPRSNSCIGDNQNNLNEADYNGGYCMGRTSSSLQTRVLDKSDTVSETSIVDSVSGLDISPDEVVGIIGQKHFWKARRAIINQQRVFAVQVFELHRLIKVQRLIAGSPQLLLEDAAFLGNTSLQASPAKKLPSDYIVTPSPHTMNGKDNSEKSDHKIESSAENAVGKTSLTSVKNASLPSAHGPYSGNSQAAAPLGNDSKMGSWCFHQSPGHQWLIPVMSPSEGLVYKPYPGPGFVGTVFGGCGPFGSTGLPGDLINAAYGFPAPHHQSIGVLPGAPPVCHSYFLPYGMPVANPTMSSPAVDQINWYPGPAPNSRSSQLSGGAPAFYTQHQSLCNVPTHRNEAVSKVPEFQRSRGSELQVSTASSPSEKAVGNGTDRNPPIPHVSAFQERSSQLPETDQPAQVIRVVPHNPRSASESAARIFRSIQEERKQHESL